MNHSPALTHPAGRATLLKRYREGLFDDTLPFWFPRCVDTRHGGYLHCVDRDGSVVDTDKSVWAQGRMAWMLSTLYNGCERRPEWLEWARNGLDFLEAHCVDTDGRFFFHVTRDGRPIRKRRYAYSESFAAIAHAAYARASQQDRHAARALDLFDRFTRWHFTPGLMSPKFTDTRPTIALGPRMITLVTAQELRDTIGTQPTLVAWIDRCIDEIKRFFVKPELHVVMETVAPDGSILDHFDGRTLNPGHAIEAAWFILREGAYQNHQSLIRLGCDMLDWMWERGWDREHGGLFYYRDVYDKPIQEYWHDMKFWWTHHEAMIATLLAYFLTGDTRYADWHDQVSHWAHGHFADPEQGEWFGYLHRDGRLSSTLKGNLWKSCFHLPRMQWVCCDWLQRLG
jgi:N-acylglucosamine 2-epimerase